MRIDPYLFFNGRCEEAIEFYKAGRGAELQMMMRNSESPEPPPPGMLPPGSEHKVMHASLLIGGALVMMSDGRCDGVADFKGFSLSLDCADEAEARRAFDARPRGGGPARGIARCVLRRQAIGFDRAEVAVAAMRLGRVQRRVGQRQAGL